MVVQIHANLVNLFDRGIPQVNILIWTLGIDKDLNSFPSPQLILVSVLEIFISPNQ
jgi:hypothetical protein